MAAQKENLLSFENLTFAERNTLRQHALTKRPVLFQAGFLTPQSNQTLRVIKLQQQWQELKERELTAKKHNRQLLQQFEEAQDRLRDMLTLNATMKTIRKEYERYLEENSPRWEQQLKKQTQMAHRKRLGESLRSCPERTERISKSSTDQHLVSQGLTEKTQNISSPQSQNNQNNFSNYNQEDFLHLPFISPSWLSHPQSQTSRLPTRAPYQPQPSPCAPRSVPPPPFLFQPPPFPLPHLASALAPEWASLLPHHLFPPTAGVAGQPMDSGALCEELHMEEHPPDRGDIHVTREGTGTSRSASSQRGSGGSRRSHLSQELDIKPVRLSHGHAESCESSNESDQATKERRKKKRDKIERSQSSSSGREVCSSQGHSSCRSSGTSSAIIFAPPTVVQSSESDGSSKRSSNKRSMRNVALTVVSPRHKMEMKEGSKNRPNNSNSEKECQLTDEEAESPTEESKSEKSENPESGSQRGDESVSVSVKNKNGSGDETESDESGDSGQKSVAEKVEEGEETDGDGEKGIEKESNRINEKQERDEEDNEASERKNTIEDEDGTETDDDETGTEDEMGEQESVEGEEISKEEDIKMRKQNSEEVDEYGSDRAEDETEVDGESDEEERGESGEEKEQSSEEAGEPEQEDDSEDSIISPQNDRGKKIYVIPEATEKEEKEDEEDEGSRTGSSEDSNGFSDEDIENLLAPQDQLPKKEEKEKIVDLKPKATCDMVDIFQAKQCRSTKENLSDSDEFDHFYD